MLDKLKEVCTLLCYCVLPPIVFSHVRALIVTTNTRIDNMCHSHQVPSQSVQHPGAVVLLYSTDW